MCFCCFALGQCRRGLTRECDLLSQDWALTRSKAKHRQAPPSTSFPHHRRNRVANQPESTPQRPPKGPPVSNQTGLSLLSFTSQQKQSSEELLSPTNLPTRWEGGEAHTKPLLLLYSTLNHSQLCSDLFFIQSILPWWGICKVRGLSATSSRLSRSSSILLHKGPFPPPDSHFETISTASRLLSQFTSPSAPTVLFPFCIQHSVSKSVLPHWFEDHIGHRHRHRHRHSGEVPPSAYIPHDSPTRSPTTQVFSQGRYLGVAKRSFIG